MKHTFLVQMIIMLGSVYILTSCSGGDTSSLSRVPSVGNEEQPIIASNLKDEYEREHGLEIFSFWAGEGEEEGIQALIRLFKEKNPMTAVTHSAAGGGGAGDAAAILEQRMSKGDMPGSYLLSVRANHITERLKPLNDLYASEGWLGRFPDEIIDMLSRDGQIYGVPLNIHRVNLLWYNKKIFKDYGLQPPETLEQLLQTAEVLQNKGVKPLLLDRTSGIWSSVLLAKLGVEDYRRYKNDLLPKDDERIEQVDEIVKQLQSFAGGALGQGTWQQAVSQFSQGNTAMYVAGDWTREHILNSNHTGAEMSYGWVPFPGTGDDFLAVVDAFGMDKEAPNQETVKEWLQLIGSLEGQTVFNLVKGSIPARTDSDMHLFDSYGQKSMDDLLRSISESNFVIDIAGPKL